MLNRQGLYKLYCFIFCTQQRCCRSHILNWSYVSVKLSFSSKRAILIFDLIFHTVFCSICCHRFFPTCWYLIRIIQKQSYKLLGNETRHKNVFLSKCSVYFLEKPSWFLVDTFWFSKNFSHETVCIVFINTGTLLIKKQMMNCY